MKIRRLEIIGFKSFVDKVVLEFPPGVTSIVGPNGCGKSNVVDAIRWAMGEQSAKNLRGRGMEDVIFGGSESRKPLGMAEVSLIFSTEDGRVPARYLDFSEIQVTRRLYRDGESEYFINKTPCRLLDITELFMDTGVGARAYSIIEQGKIGMILHAKPEERRFLIEEAAGVTKFKARKKVALKKIEVTRQNLQRLADIIGEIKRQLSALQRQAKRAEKFREYREELREIELLFAAREHQRLVGEKRQAEAALVELHSRATALATDLEKGELALEQDRLSLLEEEKGVTAAQEALYGLRGEIKSLEGRRDLGRKELENLERQQGRLTEELERLRLQLGEATAEKQRIEDRRERFTVEVGEEEQKLAAAEQRLEELSAAEQKQGRQLEDVRRELFALLAETARLGNQHATALKRLASMDERFERNRQEVEGSSQKLAEASTVAQELEQGVLVMTSRKGELQQELTALKEREEGLRSTLAALEKECQGFRDELSRKSSRLHSLKELEARFEGYGNGIRSLLLAERFKGRFRGVVADLLETDEQFENAVEAVLGERLQHVVAHGAEDVLEAVAYLHESGSGRGSFLLGLSPAAAADQAPAGAMPLLDRVTSGGDDPLVGQLLRGVYLADGLADAINLHRTHPELTFVTPQGDIVAPGGTVSGGPLDGAQHGLMHKKREIRELTHAVDGLTEKVKELETARDGARREIASAEERGRELRQTLHQEELRLVNNQKDLQRVQEDCRRLRERIELKRLEEEQLREERALLEKEMTEAGTGLGAGEEKKRGLEGEVATLQEQLSGKKQEVEQAREALTSLKVGFASLRERRDSNLRAIKRTEELVRELQGRIDRHVKDLSGGEEERERLALAIAQVEDGLQKLVQQDVRDEAAFVALREGYETLATRMRAEETRIRELRSEAEAARERLSEGNIRVSELAMGLRHLETTLQDKYRLSVADLREHAVSDRFDEIARRHRRDELQRLIEEFGEVNLLAIDEYRQMEERYNFLVAQQNDLQESLNSLNQAIQKINRTTRKRFLETFQQVNDKFREVFPRLFCGGKGELRLTDEQDLLECGIDIVVEPPGKRLQNVNLLSGGEKALTAVAMIFSIFLVKPTPFCLLDEVDAPLDDANIGRFNDMVREMSAISQFLIITHNRNTMAMADTLYGVTMEEAGVSKVVSVKLH
ncbi:MAG: chromosome segregation protein SMC [Geobacter sp.]|nr:chromosome segregation protein SMC [Geobacter sp.]